MYSIKSGLGLKTISSIRTLSGWPIVHFYVAHLNVPPCIDKMSLWPVRL